MSDFTKEELIWLEEEIRLDIDEYEQPEIAYQIHDKIKSMIDNYCEHCNHKWLSKTEPLPVASTNLEIHITNNEIICKICGAKYDNQ